MTATATVNSDGLLNVGDHCAFRTCHRLDFLPFTCPDCKANYCLDHRTATAHDCRPAPGKQQSSNSSKSRLLTGPQKLGGSDRQVKCFLTNCKTVINTTMSPATRCPECRQLTCLKHRHDHACDGSIPRKTTAATTTATSESALARFKKWTQNQKINISTAASTSGSNKQSSRLTKIKQIAELKQSAKGDAKIPVANRVYVYVESDHGRDDRVGMFFGKDWVVGKVLDRAANQLQLANMNSSKNDDIDRLRIFHVESGKVLEFENRVGQVNVHDGDTIVIVKGLQMPNLLH
ncbi:hypothetical protein V1514DRAFT_275294 [Lipomyces japonicus]|uniref:uncharacterized protein n=1 Tax=Lipomyces japonicus TaxID=56871 RepID=UPI0034CE9E84